MPPATNPTAINVDPSIPQLDADPFERTEALEIAGEPAWRPVNMLRTLESLPLRVRAA